MRKLRSISLATIAIATVAGGIAAGYLLYTYNEPIKVFEISSGRAGGFLIGETKESILSRLSNESFSPKPKTAECAANWIEIEGMSSVQMNCLLKANEWEVGSGIKELCPEKTDFFATLIFSNNKIEKIKIRCTHPE